MPRRPHTSLAALALLLAACGAAPDAPASIGQVTLAEGERMRVVATTNIVGDVVARVGGDSIDLTILMPPGQDPHSYEPGARDLSVLEGAHVVFTNGLGLEEGLSNTIAAVAAEVPIVAVSEGNETISLAEGGVHADGGGDPHVWMDPGNVMRWTETLAATLGELDPANAQVYAGNAAAYDEELAALDAYIEGQAARIPAEQRKLVTNHDALGYFARRYGFEVVGTVYVGASQLVEPSAGELGQLVETVRAEQVRAIFVETTLSEQLADVVAEEVGYEVGVYTLYTGSLGPPGSGTDSYVGMMRANIDTIVAGLGGE